MSTMLYVANDTSVVYAPATTKGAWDQTAGFVTHRLTPNRTGQRSSIGIAEASATLNVDVLLYRGVSDPLLANTTISGTLDFVANVGESSTAADDVLHLHVWVTQGDSDSVRGTLLNDFVDVTEWGTVVSGLVMPQQAITTVNALAGDRIVVEIGYRSTNTSATSRTGTLKIGGNQNDATGSEVGVSATNKATGIPFFAFSTTLEFAPTYLYLTNAAAGVAPAAVRGTWTDTAAMVTKALAPTKSGAAANVSQSETATTQVDALLYRGVSDTLAAQTITATDVTIISSLIESNVSADVVLYAHAYVMAPDGSVRGTLLSDAEFATEVDTALVQVKSFTPSSVSAQAGDRIVVELGARFKNTSATTLTARLYYGGTSGDAGATTDASNDAGDACAWIRFAQTLLWGTAGYAHSQCVVVG